MKQLIKAIDTIIIRKNPLIPGDPNTYGYELYRRVWCEIEFLLKHGRINQAAQLYDSLDNRGRILIIDMFDENHAIEEQARQVFKNIPIDYTQQELQYAQ